MEEVETVVVSGLYEDILMLCGGHKEIEDEYAANAIMDLIVKEYHYLSMVQKQRNTAMEDVMEEVADARAKKKRKKITSVTSIRGDNND